MSENIIRITLKSGKDQSLRRFHPWVFSGAIKKIYGQPADGEVVDVYDNKDEFLGRGHYQDGSIAIRILSFEQEPIDEQFWHKKLLGAYTLRKNLGLAESSETNTYRLFHAEGDGIPGLIIDYYHGHCITQCHSIGVYNHLSLIVKALQAIYGNNLKGVYDKSKSTLPSRSAEQAENHLIWGEGENTIALENSLKFKIDWTSGQKTGFFIDQRANRMALQRYSEGRKVLNMFCYTGGFSVYAMQGNAQLVHSVDSSASAIDLVDQNIALNFGVDDTRHTSYAVDAFSFLDNMPEKYDCIVLDPPAFAKHQNVLNNALQGYKRLNQRALEQIAPGGILFTFSCSQVVSKENFRKSVFAAAANARRNVRILEQLTQPIDHPVSIYHPESEYLKGLILYVE